MTKKDKVLKHLKKYGHITSKDAFERYDATRLSAIIFDLRKDYMIDTDFAYSFDEDGRKNRYGIYTLREQEN